MAVLLLIIVLGAAVALALISPIAVAGLVPVLGAAGLLIQRLLRVDTPATPQVEVAQPVVEAAPALEVGPVDTLRDGSAQG